MSMFISATPMLALTDLAVGGVLARHPRLRVGLVEFTSSWLGPFLRAVDGCYSFHAGYNGLPVDRLEFPPSHYLRRQVRATAFGFERVSQLTSTFGDLYMFGSDYPHAEGSARPLEDFRGSGDRPRRRRRLLCTATTPPGSWAGERAAPGRRRCRSHTGEGGAERSDALVGGRTVVDQRRPRPGGVERAVDGGARTGAGRRARGPEDVDERGQFPITSVKVTVALSPSVPAKVKQATSPASATSPVSAGPPAVRVVQCTGAVNCWL